METKNHLQLAISMASQNNLGTNAKYFILGNISPDINPLTYLQGHTYTDRISSMKKLAQRFLSPNTWMKQSYYDLGVLLHYVADSFTFPHNPTFTGNLSEHCNYEKELRFHFQRNLKKGLTTDTWNFHPIKNVSRLFENLDYKHQEYLSLPPSIKQDCNYILNAANYMFDNLHLLKQRVPAFSNKPKVTVPSC